METGSLHPLIGNALYLGQQVLGEFVIYSSQREWLPITRVSRRSPPYAYERDKVVLKNELDKLKRTRQIEFKEKQLSQFYWPIHFRVCKRLCNLEGCSPVVGSGDRRAGQRRT
jgi:hypothetical protein